MRNKIIILILATIVVIGGAFAYFSKEQPSDAVAKSGSYVDMPSIEAGPDYGKDFKTYTSSLGYSFKYPPYMRVIEDPDGPRVYVVDDVPEGEPFGAIVISAGYDSASLTPEQWLLGENAGYLQNKERYGNYYKTHVDGQEAVYTDGGMWFVVNAPDNKTRFSIAYTAGEGADIPFSQMGIVMESFAFKR